MPDNEEMRNEKGGGRNAEWDSSKNICNAGLIVSIKEHSGSRLKTPTS